MADCALCGHPRDHHTPRCGHVFGDWSPGDSPVYCRDVCTCPGFEPPEDEEND